MSDGMDITERSFRLEAEDEIVKLKARIKELEAEVEAVRKDFLRGVDKSSEDNVTIARLREALESIVTWTEGGYKTKINVMMTIIESAHGIATETLERDGADE